MSLEQQHRHNALSALLSNLTHRCTVWMTLFTWWCIPTWLSSAASPGEFTIRSRPIMNTTPRFWLHNEKIAHLIYKNSEYISNSLSFPELTNSEISRSSRAVSTLWECGSTVVVSTVCTWLNILHSKMLRAFKAVSLNNNNVCGYNMCRVVRRGKTELRVGFTKRFRKLVTYRKEQYPLSWPLGSDTCIVTVSIRKVSRHTLSRRLLSYIIS